MRFCQTFELSDLEWKLYLLGTSHAKDPFAFDKEFTVLLDRFKKSEKTINDPDAQPIPLA